MEPEIEEPAIAPFERKGFTVIEYGTEAMEILATIKITEGVNVEYLD